MNRVVRLILFLIIGVGLVGLIGGVFMGSRRGSVGPGTPGTTGSINDDAQGVSSISGSPEDSGKPADPGAVINTVSYSGTEDGRLLWELRADSAARSDETRSVVLKRVFLTHYTQNSGNSTVSYRLKGREAVYDEKIEQVKLTGRVKLTSDLEGGYVMTTDSVTYMAGEHRVSTGRPVKLTSPRFTLRGVGFNMDFDSGELEVVKDVRAELKEGFL